MHAADSRRDFPLVHASRLNSVAGSTRLVVRLLAGRDLLASDVETGKSDPLALVWCCSTEVRRDRDHAKTDEAQHINTHCGTVA